MSGDSCRDLSEYNDGDSILDAFSALVSGGKVGYKTVIEKKVYPPKCSGCGRIGRENEKFCGECGGKMIVPLTHCPACRKSVNDTQKFCISCGFKLKE
ncbi:zinc ribbon domain-containing protein [Candidatus Pacearchaeota archaeon]|nr:zinc ribbon domain-containing protein [Candidatus Pacearchaeota archaeon]